MNTSTNNSLNTAFARDRRWIYAQTKAYQYFGMDKEDLTQEGARAWSEAATRVSPIDNAALFRAYALPFIRRALLEYAFANQRIVSADKSRKVESVILSLRKAIQENRLTPGYRKEVSLRYNMDFKEVSAWEQYLKGGDTDCSALTGGEIPISADTLELLCWSEKEAQYLACEIGVKRLSKRERSIIERRYLNETQSTLDAIGKDFGVSTTRAWQIEQQAIGKLRTIVDKLPVISASA